MQVVALIDEENGVYGASFPDFPDCVTVANDPDEVLSRAAEVLALHIDAMIAEGRELPHVRPLSRLIDDRTFLESAAGALVALVPYAPSKRPVKLSITIDQALLARIDQAAHAAGETRSAFLAEAAQQRLALPASAETQGRASRTPLVLEAETMGVADAAGGGARATPDCQDSVWGAPRPALAPPAEPPSPAVAEQSDTAASLATIREILEHLNQSGATPTRGPELRPAKRGHA